jgi:hypothetical protein
MSGDRRRFAEDTKVPISRSIDEIRSTVARYGGEQFLHAAMDDRLIVGFTKEGRQVRFQVSQDPADAQNNRRLARALLLVLKAKLEAVASGVSIFDDEFLANIVMPDGKLVATHIRPRLAAAYAQGGEAPALLPDFSQ